MKITQDQIDNINNVDKVATYLFGVEALGFRFNTNIRWFWVKAVDVVSFEKTLINLPISEAQIVNTIFLN